MREFAIEQPEPVDRDEPALGRLAPVLRRLAAQQGSWPPAPPAQVARVAADPGRTTGLSTADALEAGAAAADRLVDAGVDLVVVGGGGSRTPALVLLAALLGRDPVAVTGTVGGPGWAALVTDVRDGLRRARPHLADPAALLDALGAGEVAELTGLLLQCAERRTGVLLSGAADVWAAALVAQRVAPYVGSWLVAGCGPGLPVTAAALAELQLDPLLDLELDDPAGAELALGVLVGRPGWRPERPVPDGLRLALTTLTVARVRGPRVLSRRTAGQAMALAPLVGAGLGAVAAAVLLGLRAVTDADLLPAVAAVATLAALTRGLHLDGLADTADGLASYLPAERAREVMKAPDVGALGMVTVVLALALQAAALAACGGRGGGAVLLAAVAGRVAVAGACTPVVPAAASSGLGALVAGTVRPWVAVLWVLVAVAGGATLDGLRGGLAVLAGLAVAALLLRHAVRRLGGITGDVLGALVEVTTTAALLVLAAR